MWWIVTAVLVFVVYDLGLAIYRSCLAKQLGIQAHPYRQAGTGPNFLVVGDSTAVGTGSKDPNNSTAGRLGADFRTAQITNLGVNGARVQDLSAILRGVSSQSFDLVLIQIGGNDVAKFTPLKPLEIELEIVLKQAKKLSENVIVITAGDVGAAPFWPLWTGRLFSRRKRHVRRIFIRQCNRAQVVFVDLYANKFLAPLMSDWQFYAPDGFHPNDLGYEVWYKEIKEAMNFLPKSLT